MLTTWVKQLTKLEDLHWRSFPKNTLQAIQSLRNCYEEGQTCSFSSLAQKTAYWLFWFPRQVQILKSFLDLASHNLQFPIFDYGIGGAPGAFLYPGDSWYGFDLDLTLANSANQILNHPVKFCKPQELFQTVFPKTILMLMSYGEIQASFTFIQHGLERGSTFIVIEPGTKIHSHAMMELRDHFYKFVEFTKGYDYYI